MIAGSYVVTAIAWAAILSALALSIALAVRLIAAEKSIGILSAEVTAAGAFAGPLAELQKQVEQIGSQVSEAEQRRLPGVDWSSESASLHLNHRGQVLRMHRRGESSSEIASALGLSPGEVTLIVKVHELTRSDPDTEKSGQQSLIARRSFDTDTRGRK